MLVKYFLIRYFKSVTVNCVSNKWIFLLKISYYERHKLSFLKFLIYVFLWKQSDLNGGRSCFLPYLGIRYSCLFNDNSSCVWNMIRWSCMLFLWLNKYPQAVYQNIWSYSVKNGLKFHQVVFQWERDNFLIIELSIC